VREGLDRFPAGSRDQVLLLFSAHSLPTRVINRGDPYPQEVGASVQAIVEELKLPNPYLLAYQSAVGPVAWQGPSTEQVIRDLGRQGQRKVLVVPVAFTSDHIETLAEIDLEYGALAKECGISEFHRAAALNAAPGFLRALGEIASRHLAAGEASSTQYPLRCPGCSNPECRQIVNPNKPGVWRP
jgi:protoporphyrin/coproporphyrin ferrochelatase